MSRYCSTAAGILRSMIVVNAVVCGTDPCAHRHAKLAMDELDEDEYDSLIPYMRRFCLYMRTHTLMAW